MSDLCETCISREDCNPDETEHCAARDYWFYENEEGDVKNDM